MTTSSAQKTIQAEGEYARKVKFLEAKLGALAPLIHEEKVEAIKTFMRSFENFVEKSGINRGDQIVLLKQAQVEIYPLLKLDIERNLDRLMELTRANMLEERTRMIANVRKLVDDLKDLTRLMKRDEEFFERVRKNIAIALETSAAGDSAKAKAFAEEQARRFRRERKYENEKRRFMRFRDPALSIRIEEDQATYEAIDFSLGGIAVKGSLPAFVQPGQKVQITVGLMNTKDIPPAVATATVQNTAGDARFGLSFSSTDGPIMALVRRKVVDLTNAIPA